MLLSESTSEHFLGGSVLDTWGRRRKVNCEVACPEMPILQAVRTDDKELKEEYGRHCRGQ